MTASNRPFSRVQHRCLLGGRRTSGRHYLTALASLALASWSFAANAAWNVDADGNWFDAANWNPATPPGAGSGFTSADIATFSKALTAVRTATVDANRNVGGITFSQSSNFGYTLAGGPLLLSSAGTIQFTNSTPTTGTQVITVSAPVVIQGDGGTGTFYGNGTSTVTSLNMGEVSGVSTAGNTTTLRLFGFNALSNRINGIISDGAAGGKLAVNKGGSGTWTLAGNNTYSGGTTVTSGALAIGANSSPTSGTVTSGPLGTGSLTLAGGFIQAGVANATVANPVIVSPGTSTNVRGVSIGNVILTGPITGTGTFTNNHTTSASAIVQGDISGFTGTFAHNTVANGNNFTFNGTTPESQDGSKARFVLSGATTGRAINVGSASATTFKMGDLSGTGGRIAPNTTGVTLQIGALNTGQTASFSGVITGSLSVEKVGSGTLVFGGANSFTGNTTVSTGTLRVTGSLAATPTTVATGASIGGEGTIAQTLTLASGSRLAFDSGTAGALSVADLVLGDSVALDLEAANLTPSVGQTVRVLNYSGALTGTPDFNTSKLRNASLSTATPGQINVTFDTKNLVWSGQTGVWNLGDAANWNSGADVFYQGDVITFDDTGANKSITLLSDVTPASVLLNNSIGSDYVIGGAGRLVGSVGVTKTGSGTVTLTGAQAYTGTTTVNSGTLKAGGLAGPWAVGTGGILEITGINGLQGAGAVSVAAGGTVVLDAANNYTGATSVDGTLQLRDASSAATTSALNLNTGGVLQLRSDVDTGFTLPAITLSSGGNATIDVAPATSASNRMLSIASLAFTGTGAVSSTVNTAGTDGYGLTINGLSITNNSTVSSGNSRTRLFLKSNSAPITVTGNITATSASNRDVGIVLDGTGTDGRFLSRITNAGGGWTFLDKQGPGMWTLSGTNCNYAGATTIGVVNGPDAGILRVETTSAISTSSAVQFNKGGTKTGTLQLNVPGTPTFTQAMNALSSSTFGAGGTANIQNLQGDTTLSGNLTINGTGGSGMNIQSDVGGTLKLTGTLSNNVANSTRGFDLGGAGNGEVAGIVANGTATGAITSLVKEGPGTWTITGAANTYTGNTTVNGGALVVTGSGTLGTGAFILGNGATLDISGLTASSFNIPAGLSGSGVLNAAGKSVQINGAFNPLAISITGTVSLGVSSASTFTADSSGATRSTTVVTGSLVNAGSLTITQAPGFAFAGGETFDFVESSGGISPGYTSVTIVATPLSQSSAGVWTGTDGVLGYTYTESTGVLTVQGTTIISPIQAWRNVHFPTAGNDGSGIGADIADPDGDGIPNLLEYATNTNPTAASSSPVTVSNVGGRLALNFVQISDPALTYTVQGSDDLATWSTVTPLSGTNPVNGFTSSNPSLIETQNVQVVDSVLLSSQPRRFLRLQVSVVP